MQSTPYLGFDIVSPPVQAADSGLWTVEVEIRRDARSRSFSVGARYPSEREAHRQCRDLGIRIIDGNIPGWSVETLRPRGGKQPALAYLFEPRAVAVFLVAALIILGLGGSSLFR